jgi:hypothetical protein
MGKHRGLLGCLASMAGSRDSLLPTPHKERVLIV